MPWIANRGEGWVETNPAPPDTVCISITEPIGPCKRQDVAKVPKGYVDVLRLQFQDYDPVRGLVVRGHHGHVRGPRPHPTKGPRQR